MENIVEQLRQVIVEENQKLRFEIKQDINQKFENLRNLDKRMDIGEI